MKTNRCENTMVKAESGLIVGMDQRTSLRRVLCFQAFLCLIFFIANTQPPTVELRKHRNHTLTLHLQNGSSNYDERRC